MIQTITNWLIAHPWAILALVVHGIVLGTVAYLILLERKVASWVQDRLGPNRVGLGFGIIPWLKDKKMLGLGQPLADGLKFILKEDYQPKGVDKILFTVAPAVMILVVIISIAVVPLGGTHKVTRTADVTGQVDAKQAAATKLVPFGGSVINVEEPNIDASGKTLVTVTYQYPFQIARLNIGVLYIIAVLSLAIYGVVLGGWASNNKYSFLGGLRATAQMISYEIPLGLTLLCVVLMHGTLDLGDIVDQQSHYWAGFIPAWNDFAQPITFLMFLTCIHAEANRAPFDMAECEQELVGGYHTEYSAMRFALFFLAEYAGMITTSAMCVALFFGGWHFPGLTGGDPHHPSVTTSLGLCLIRSGVFFAKTVLIIFIFMWTRWSLPRFRFDQLMTIAWRAMIPISLALLLVTAFVLYAFGPRGRVSVDDYPALNGYMALALAGGNIALILVTMGVSRLIPAAPDTNRRMRVAGSRFNPVAKAALPAAASA